MKPEGVKHEVHDEVSNVKGPQSSHDPSFASQTKFPQQLFVIVFEHCPSSTEQVSTVQLFPSKQSLSLTQDTIGTSKFGSTHDLVETCSHIICGTRRGSNDTVPARFSLFLQFVSLFRLSSYQYPPKVSKMFSKFPGQRLQYDMMVAESSNGS